MDVFDWDTAAGSEFDVANSDLSSLEVRAAGDGDHSLCYFYEPSERRLIKSFVLADGDRVRTLMNVTLIRKGDALDRGVMVAFDGDEPGRLAALRAFELLRRTGVWPHALALPAGQDPADLFQQHGPAGLHAALLAAAARPLADLLVDDRIDQHRDQLHWAEGAVAAARAAAAVIATLPTEHIGRQVARVTARLELPASTMTGLVIEAVASPTRRSDQRPAPQTTAPASGPTLDLRSARPASDDQPAAPQPMTAAQRARAGFPVALQASLPPPTPPPPGAPSPARHSRAPEAHTNRSA